VDCLVVVLSRLPMEAKLLRLDVDSKTLNAKISDYRTNLITSANVLRGRWEHCLKKGYKVADPTNGELARATKQQLDSLASQRGALIGNCVYLFAPSEPKILQALSGD
jgi:hypothetical protein